MKDFYVSRSAQNVTLYFIKPQTMQMVTGSKGVDKSISFDNTYLTTNSYVRMLFTVKSDYTFEAEKVEILTGKENTATSYPATAIYKECNIGVWENRMEIHIPYSNFCKMNMQQNPYQLRFVLHGQTYTFAISSSKWKTLHPKYNFFSR